MSAVNALSAASSLFSVAGKNVLVTGGSRGIGLMIATGYANAGANVLLTSRDPKACEEAAASIAEGEGVAATGGTVRHVESNLGSRDGCRALAEAADEVFGGRVDVLVNNAGTSWGEDPYKNDRTSRANWGFDKVLDLNVKGLFYLTRECIPMLERPWGRDGVGRCAPEDPGRIINIGSVVGTIPQEAPTHAYEVSKAAVHHLTRKMAADLAPRGITVNCLAPGFTPTRMSDGYKSWGVEREKFEGSIPLGRMGNADDMAGACFYLSSRAGSWCTGVILHVDGGTTGASQIPVLSL